MHKMPVSSHLAFSVCKNFCHRRLKIGTYLICEFFFANFYEEFCKLKRILKNILKESSQFHGVAVKIMQRLLKLFCLQKYLRMNNSLTPSTK